MRTRAITSTVFVIVMATAILLSEWTCYALFFVIGVLCLWEYLSIVLEKTKNESGLNNLNIKYLGLR